MKRRVVLDVLVVVKHEDAGASDEWSRKGALRESDSRRM
jgi:hypothetical protein